MNFGELRLTKEEKEELYRYYSQFEWCECSLGDWNYGDAVFHENGECGVVYKHHWHCSRCKKLTEIG